MNLLLIDDNPLRVLGVFANSTSREIEQNKAQLRAFARVGQEAELPLWLNGLSLLQPLPPVTEELLAEAQAQLSLQADREHYARFWFERDSDHAQEDEEALNLLNDNKVDEACLLWRKRSDDAAQKNLLLLAVLRDDWDGIAEHAPRYFEGSLSRFRLFMGEVVKACPIANSLQSHALLAHFIQESWKKEMERVLTDHHKHSIDAALDSLKRTGTTDAELLRKEIEKAYAEVSHVEALRNLLGDESYTYSFYANETAKTLLNAISDYMHLNNCSDTDKWAVDMVRKLCGYLSDGEPERLKLLVLKSVLEQRVSGQPSSNSDGCLTNLLCYLFFIIIGVLIRTCDGGKTKQKERDPYIHYYDRKYTPRLNPQIDSLQLRRVIEGIEIDTQAMRKIVEGIERKNKILRNGEQN